MFLMLTDFGSRTNNSDQFIENKIDGLLTKKMLADKLKYSVSYINKLMRQCKIPYLKNGKCVRFKFMDVLAALERESTT